MSLVVHPVTRERWPDLVDLFERRGPRGGMRNTPAYGCWCMYWRDRSLPHGEPKKRAMAKLVRAGCEPGLLAYEDGDPVGWVSVAPRAEYTAILASPQYGPREDGGGPSVWSIVCFAIDRNAQRQGVASSYPHVAKADDYMGGKELYRRAGFAHVRDANKRAIVRLER